MLYSVVSALASLTYTVSCLTENLRVSRVLVHAHKSGTMSVEEKFQEYKLVPDVLRVAPSEKAEVSLKKYVLSQYRAWTALSHMKNETAQVGNCLFIDQRTLKDWN